MQHRVARIAPTLVVGALCAAACVTNPYTGKSQLLLLSESQETQMGVSGYAEVSSSSSINTDLDLNEPLRRVGRNIAAVADAWRRAEGLAPYEWEFKVIADDATVNAWCMPGGKIAFYTGIYPILEDENAMAVVMGHEVSHALLRHGNERVSQNLITQLGLTAADAVNLGGKHKDLALAALGTGAQLGVLLPFSREHETDADRLGLEIAARAGYDPRAAVGLWERMAASGGGRPPEFLSTHPDPANRIANMQRWMPEMLQLWERSQKQQNRRLPDALGRGGTKPKKAATDTQQVAPTRGRARR